MAHTTNMFAAATSTSWTFDGTAWNQSMTLESPSGDIAVNIPPGHPGYTVTYASEPSGAPAKQEAVPTMGSNANTVAYDLAFTDGTTETVEAVSDQFSDGVVLFSGKDRSIVASYNQELLKSWKPVTATERPALVEGKYTFSIELADGTKRLVQADSFTVNSVDRGDEDALLTYRFTTSVVGGTRDELTLNADLVSAVARTEATGADTADTASA